MKIVAAPGIFTPYRPRRTKRKGSSAVEIRQRPSNRRKLAAWLKRKKLTVTT